MRNRVRWVLTSEAGDVESYAEFRVYAADGVTLYDGPLYRDAVSGSTYPNPFKASPAVVDIFLDGGTQVILGYATDDGRPEVQTPVLEVLPDADEIVYSLVPQNLTDPPRAGLLLRTDSTGTGIWYQPGLANHDHGGPGPQALVLGHQSAPFSQYAGFAQATMIGAHDENVTSALDDLVVGSVNDFEATTSVGASALGLDVGATAAGNYAHALGLSSTAVGSQASAEIGATAVGQQSWADTEGVTLGTGGEAGVDAVVLGPHAVASDLSVAIGHQAVASAPGNGNVVLGAHAQHEQRELPTILLGTGDAVVPVSPDVEGTLAMLQPYLDALIPGDLAVSGTAAFGSPDSALGFYGAPGVPATEVGKFEVASGIEALDSLIYALRDLGLLKTRSAPVSRFLHEGLHQHYRYGDEITEWPSAEPGAPSLVAPPGAEPRRSGEVTAEFGRTTPPVEKLVAQELSPVRYELIMLWHQQPVIRSHEGATGNLFINANRAWDFSRISSITRDGLTQPTGIDPGILQGHVYRVRRKDETPGELVVGTSGKSYGVNWGGTLVDLTQVGPSWSEEDIKSLEEGLMFYHDARDFADARFEAALAFLRKQQNDGTTVIDLNGDFAPTSARRMVSGRVTGFPGISSFAIPLLRLARLATVYSFAYLGGISGFWSYVDNHLDYWVEVYCFDTPFVGLYPPSKLVGRFALNANGTWSTGTKTVRRGEKRVRLVRRSNLTQVDIDEWVPGCYYDAAVKIYTVNDTTGVRTLEDTVPLQSRGGFCGVTKHSGRVVADLVRRSNGSLIASTERPLPLDMVPRASDPGYTSALLTLTTVYSSALAALCYAAAGQVWWLYRPFYFSRAADIIRRLLRLQITSGATTGAFATSHHQTTLAVVDATVRPAVAAWAGIAALAVGQSVGTPMMFASLVNGVATYLRSQQHGTTRSIPDVHAGSNYSTEVNVVAWRFFADLAAAQPGTTAGDDARDTAADIAVSLETNHWLSDQRRYRTSIGTSDRDTRADTLGALFSLATGDTARARSAMRSLSLGKLQGVSTSDDFFPTVTGLSGYRPQDVSGPAIIDHELTWLVMQLKQQAGEPFGQDIAALKKWATSSGSSTGAPFLAFSADHSASGRVVRPSLAVAAQLLLLCLRPPLWWAPPPVPPEVTDLDLEITRLSAGYRFDYSWSVTGIAAAFEVVAERSFNGGSSWVAMPNRSLSGQMSRVRRRVGDDEFILGSWVESGSMTSSILTRVRVRVRGREFGSWVTSGSVHPS